MNRLNHNTFERWCIIHKDGFSSLNGNRSSDRHLKTVNWFVSKLIHKKLGCKRVKISNFESMTWVMLEMQLWAILAAVGKTPTILWQLLIRISNPFTSITPQAVCISSSLNSSARRQTLRKKFTTFTWLTRHKSVPRRSSLWFCSSINNYNIKINLFFWEQIKSFLSYTKIKYFVIVWLGLFEQKMSQRSNALVNRMGFDKVSDCDTLFGTVENFALCFVNSILKRRV